MTNGRVLSRVLTAAQRASTALKSPRAQRITWAVAVVVFIGGFAASIASQPQLLSSFRLDAALVLIFFLCPAMTMINMATTKETARLAGVNMGFSAALKLTVMSSAANHLPAPGGPLLRTAVIQAAGGSLKDAGLANVASGLIWMSATFLFAGAWALLLDVRLASALFLLGAILFIVTFAIARSLPGKHASLMRLLPISLISAAAYAFSIYVALNAFGTVWPFPQAAVIAASGVIGAASSIAPSGLGVREAAAAGLASLIGADPAAAFTATATVHIAMAAFTGAIALYFFVRGETRALTT